MTNLSCAPGSLDALTTDAFEALALPRESDMFDVPEVFFERNARRQKEGR